MKITYFFALFFITALLLSSGCGGSSSDNFTPSQSTISQDTSPNEQNPTEDTTNTNPNSPDINTENEDNSGGTETPSDTPQDSSGGGTTTSTDISGDDSTVSNDNSGTEAQESGDISIQETASATSDSEHAITVDGTTEEYSNYLITKTGSPSTNSDNYDFYGTNAAVFATNGASLTLKNSIVSTDAVYANAVFVYGSGTTVNVSDTVITTNSRNSGGIMTTGGATMNATNLNITTYSGSSAPIRSDRGGGTITVNGGEYTAFGVGSPAIYSTADITVSNADLTARASQVVVVEGKNSVTLNNCTSSADHTTINGNQTTRHQAVMIYQSGSGDASEGKGAFTITHGSITNSQGDIFYVTNTIADITLNDADFTNNDDTGAFLRAEAAGWGSSGSNGGKVNLYANDQTIKGDIIVDASSGLNMYLADGSLLEGAVNEDNSGGSIFVNVNSSVWTLTGDSYITSLTCGTDNINLNGHKLYVNGTEYTSGTESTGSAIEFSSGNSSDSSRPGGTPPERPGDSR